MCNCAIVQLAFNESAYIHLIFVEYKSKIVVTLVILVVCLDYFKNFYI